LAHELSQPVAGVLTNSSAVSGGLSSRTSTKPRKRWIESPTTRSGAAEFIGYLRRFLKRSDDERSPLVPEALIREVLALLKPELAKHEIVYTEAFAQGLPKAMGPESPGSRS
jgi:hypothetical protein